ncbi:hypothetical protein NQ317_010840 [Molorchus minor]|uniref:Uncharacterized protein n=1 Tax=Molorchus minor TaxID=1323400 RepID=A0ABQ9K140_9CUCU|nr:hypothetical protein NQ317_010840 [Molorchus minor]
MKFHFSLFLFCIIPLLIVSKIIPITSIFYKALPLVHQIILHSSCMGYCQPAPKSPMFTVNTHFGCAIYKCMNMY